MTTPYPPEFQTQLLSQLDTLKKKLGELNVVLQIGLGQTARRSAEVSQIKSTIEAAATQRAQLSQDGEIVEDMRAVIENLKSGVRPAAERLHRIDRFLQGTTRGTALAA